MPRPSSERTAVIVSFRLGAPDGVSVQAATWGRALERLGFVVRRVAGELTDGPRPGDVVIPGLGVAAAAAPGPDGQRPPRLAPPPAGAVAAALDGAAVIVVENLLSLPLNLPAAAVLTGILEARLAAGRGGVILHHHDFAWQRPELGHLSGLPPRLPGARHVAINDFSAAELAERGIPAVTIRNAFDLDAPRGGRTSTRRHLGLGPDDLLVLQPTRAVARKNIPAALRLTEALGPRLGRRAVYWLPGPAEDGYAAELAGVLAGARVQVLRQGEIPMADAYAACDLVAFPSTGGEGFGQPVIESVWARRPLAVASYRALDEILGLGFSFLPVGDPDAVADALAEPDPAAFDRHLELARRHFSIDALVERLADLLDPG